MDIHETQDAVADELANLITVSQDGDTLISANRLREALSAMGLPVVIRGLEANAEGDSGAEALFTGMARMIHLLVDTMTVVVARDELERM